MHKLGQSCILYQKSTDPAKMTYSRFNLVKRDPSFTQLKQNAMSLGQAIARESCKAMINMHMHGVVIMCASITL